MSESNQPPSDQRPADQRDAYFCIPIDDPRVQTALRTAGRNLPEVDPGKYHLTLRYIKSTPDLAAEILADIGERICRDQPTFELRLGQPGRFEKPPVNWYGLEPSPGLMKLQADLGQAILALGYPSADYDYNPHISLGRSQQPVPIPTVPSVTWTVEAVEFRRAGTAATAKPPPVRLPLKSD